MTSSALPRHIDILLTALNESKLAVGLYAPDDRLAWTNQAFRDAFALLPLDTPTFDDMIRHSYQTGLGCRIDTTDVDAWLAMAHRKRRSQPHRAFATDLADGRWLWLEETALPDDWLLVVGSDITALKLQERHLSQSRDAALHEAHTDALTGLYNRRYVLDRLHEAVTHHHELAVPLGVAVLDLDHFKPINDTYGHAAGDAVLRHFARYLQRRVRQEDVIGRIGGEEFLLLMPATPQDDAFHTVERLRRALPQCRPLANKPELRYSLSAGVTTLAANDTVDSLLLRADRALYAAKAAGRNRVHRAE